MTESNDCIAMGLVAAGDNSAFEGLVSRNRDRLVRWLSRYRRNDADDLAQEVFIRIFQGAKNFRPGDFQAYMFRIARNLLIDKCRRRSARPEEISMDMEEWICRMSGNNPLEVAVVSEIRERTEASLQHLPVEQSMTISMYVDGHTLPEIADQFDLPLATVKSRLRNGRVRMIEKMGNAAHEFVS